MLKFNKVIPYLILIITLPSISQWLNVDTNNLTTIWWILYTFLIIIFFKGRKFYYKESLPIEIRLFEYLVIIESFYGIILSYGYWDYKVLINNLFTFLLPLSIFVFSNPSVLQRTLNKWFRIALVAFFFFIPIMQPEAPTKYLIPVMFMLLFIKPLRTQHKFILLLFFSFIFIFGSLGARASVLKYIISLLMGLSTYIGIYKRKKLLKIVRRIMIALPIILLIAGFFGNFNVFDFNKYISGISNLSVENSFDPTKKENLSADTRTFIYMEAINSAINNNYWLQGHSLARGYSSQVFGDYDLYGRGERADSEVSIINVFTHLGIIGFILYFLIFFLASKKAINQSRNSYIKIIGIHICFRWVLAFVEDFSKFDLNYLFLWIMIGMCYSSSFREMTDQEFEDWIRGIFTKKKSLNKSIYL